MELYKFYSDTSLKLSDGDQQKADYLLDCSVYEFHYRYRNITNFIEWKNKPIKS